jgi:hypothetical protein
MSGPGGCCSDCDDKQVMASGTYQGCSGCGPAPMAVAGLSSELAAAKWLAENRWAIGSVTFAVLGLLWAGGSYWVNRDGGVGA